MLLSATMLPFPSLNEFFSARNELGRQEQLLDQFSERRCVLLCRPRKTGICGAIYISFGISRDVILASPKADVFVE